MQRIRKSDIGRDKGKVEQAIKEVMREFELKYENLADEILVDIEDVDVPQTISILRNEYSYI